MIKCVSENCDYYKLYKECSSVCLHNHIKKDITNADRIRNMDDEELAKELTRNPSIPCRMCEYYDNNLAVCRADFPCVVKYAEALTINWLKQPVCDDEGTVI